MAGTTKGFRAGEEAGCDKGGRRASASGEYYNARRREVEYKVGDLVMKRNRILSLAAQGILAKLAPKYAGPLKLIEVTGSNTVKVVDDHEKNEEVLHVSHLKPVDDAAESSDVSVAKEDDIEEPQPPRETTNDPVMSDPPEVGGAPSNAIKSVEKRPPGRPRKTVRVMVRAKSKKARDIPRKNLGTGKPRGRPKGSKNRPELTVNQNVSPRSTLAQRLVARWRGESGSESS